MDGPLWQSGSKANCAMHLFTKLILRPINTWDSVAKYLQNWVKIWPDLGFTNGNLNGQLSVLYFALKWSNSRRTLQPRGC